MNVAAVMATLDVNLVAFEYVIMLDAGSTGTRSHIYRIADDEIKKIGSRKITPGLSTFNLNPNGGFPYLRGLLDDVKEKIPKHAWPITPVYIYATAGMRLIKEDEQQSIYDAVFQDWDSKNYPFRVQRGNFRTISGDEEGFFAMLSVNYLTDRIGTSMSHRFGDLYGALDLGGSSTQILFELIPKPYLRNYARAPMIEMSNFYVHSFLGYGADKMKDKVNAHVIQQQPGDNVTSHIPSPCYFKGYTSDVTDKGQIVGTGDSEACRAIIKEILLSKKNCTPSPCSFDNVHQPAIRGEFYAMSMYFYAVDFSRALVDYAIAHKLFVAPDAIISAWPTPSPQDIIEVSKPICNLDWSVVSTKLATLHNQTFPNQLPNRCLELSYIASLLHDGYGFALDSKAITYASDVKGMEVEWTLGAFLQAHAKQMKFIEANQDLILAAAYEASAVVGRTAALLVLVAASVVLYLHVRRVLKARSTGIVFYKDNKSMV